MPAIPEAGHQFEFDLEFPLVVLDFALRGLARRLERRVQVVTEPMCHERPDDRANLEADGDEEPCEASQARPSGKPNERKSAKERREQRREDPSPEVAPDYPYPDDCQLDLHGIVC
jgi:hypothetical protein